MQHEGITVHYASTYPLALAIQQRMRAANPLCEVEVKVAYGLGYDVVTSVERCTGWVGSTGDDAERCGAQAVAVSVDREEARCLDCRLNDLLAGRPMRPLHILG